MKRLMFAALLAAAAVGTSGCGGKNTPADTQPAIEPAAETDTNTAAADAAETDADASNAEAAQTEEDASDAAAAGADENASGAAADASPAAAETAQEATLEHGIGLTGVNNARELGGYQTSDGKTVKKGVFLRTAALENATDADIARLKEEYHLATIVDFRMAREQELSPELTIEGVKNVHIPIIDETEMAEKQSSLTPEDLEGIDVTTKVGQLRVAMKAGFVGPQLYVDFLSGDVGKAGYAKFFQEILSLPEGGSILFHCSQGKDRTDCGAMLILSALGVDKETIMEDFLLTNRFNEKLIAGERQMLAEEGLEGEELEALMKAMDEVDPEYMETAFDWMEKEYGSALGYITKELGVTDEEIGQLKEMYLE